MSAYRFKKGDKVKRSPLFQSNFWGMSTNRYRLHPNTTLTVSRDQKGSDWRIYFDEMPFEDNPSSNYWDCQYFEFDYKVVDLDQDDDECI